MGSSKIVINRETLADIYHDCGKVFSVGNMMIYWSSSFEFSIHIPWRDVAAYLEQFPQLIKRLKSRNLDQLQTLQLSSDLWCINRCPKKLWICDDYFWKIVFYITIINSLKKIDHCKMLQQMEGAMQFCRKRAEKCFCKFYFFLF